MASHCFARPRAAVFIVALLAARHNALAQSGAADVAPESLHVLALKAPSPVATFTIVDRRDFHLPTGDIGYTYASSADSDHVQLNAFFYQRDSTTLGLTSTAAVVRQGELFRQVLPIERARGAFEAYNVPLEGADSIVVGPRRMVIPSYHMYVAFRRGGRVYLSYFDVYAVGDGFIKIRYTVPEAGWESRNFQGLAREIVARAIAGS